MKMQSLVVCVALAAVSGCSSKDEVDIGDERTGKTGEKLSDYADVWEGYVEAYEFSDGSDKLRIVLDAEGDGTLVVGDSADPSAEPTSPPPPRLAGLYWDELAPGFPYTVKAPELDGARLKLQVQRVEAYTAWCSLIEPVLFSTTGEEDYHCYPSHSTSLSRVDAEGRCFIRSSGQSEETEIDCGLYACDIQYACECTAASCATVELPTTEPRLEAAFSFLDVALDSDDRMVGTLVTNVVSEDDSRLTVRLRRQ